MPPAPGSRRFNPWGRTQRPMPSGAQRQVSVGNTVHNGGTNAAHSGSGNPNIGRPPTTGNRIGYVPRSQQGQTPVNSRNPNRPVPTNRANPIVRDFTGPSSANSLPEFGFTFDPELAAIERRLFGSEAGIASEEAYQRQMIQQQYENQQRQMQQAFQQALQNNETRMADQGILRSGINVGEQGRLGQAQQQGMAGLEQNKVAQLEQLVRQILDQRTQIEWQREDLQFEQARREQQIREAEALQRAQMEANQQHQNQLQQMLQEQLAAQQPVVTPTGNLQPGPAAPPMPSTPPSTLPVSPNSPTPTSQRPRQQTPRGSWGNPVANRRRR